MVDLQVYFVFCYHLKHLKFKGNNQMWTAIKFGKIRSVKYLLEEKPKNKTTHKHIA